MRTIKDFNSHQTALISPTGIISEPDLLDEAVRQSKNEIDFRKAAVRNMWLMIITMCIVNTYEIMYSAVLALRADGDCYLYDK